MLLLVLNQRNIRPGLHCELAIVCCQVQTISLIIFNLVVFDRKLRFHIGVAAEHALGLLLDEKPIVENFQSTDTRDLLRELLLHFDAIFLVLCVKRDVRHLK